MHIVDALVQQVVSKIIVDRSKIPRGPYNAIKPLIVEIREWATVFESFDSNNPASVISVGSNLLDRMIEPEKRVMDPQQMFLIEQGYVYPIPPILQSLFQIALQDTDMRHIADINNRQFYKADITDEIDCMVTALAADEGDNREDRDYQFWLPHDEKIVNKAFKEVAKRFWKDTKAFLLDFKDGDFLITEYEFPNREYKGPVLDYIIGLQEYAKKGIRRVVIIQGVPGTGKSTLCAHAAKTLSDRSLILTADFLSDIPKSDWNMLLAVLNPHMVIVDDIDRMGRNLETSLYMFEDAYYRVPVTLMTTNDQRSLPAAFRRPGRVDQIIDMPEPGEDIIEEVVIEIAKMEGVTDIPKDTLEYLCEIYREYPGAHLVELLRRFKVEGWDYRIPPNDLTFSEFKKEDLNKMIKQVGMKI